MISIDGKLIGKPLNNNDAFNILKSLDGRKHQVRTGICLINKIGKKVVFSVETEESCRSLCNSRQRGCFN
uniref:Uncharacterized protein n=1 Tax=Meloidogyne enterolobii TaxID=390850 RepID=A0A6V7V2W6_MELEN|nr:unnamed protein product [Meloidogyne enterolobii]